MISSHDAQAIVLRLLNGSAESDFPDRSVIQTCELSAHLDFWIVRANSAAFVLHGKQEHQRVGVNAYLVSTTSGCVEIVGSRQSVEDNLEDRYNAEMAGDRHYILSPSFTRQDKVALINLRQKLECTYKEVLLLVSAPRNAWMTGTLRNLQDAKALLERQSIAVGIELQPAIAKAIEIDGSAWFWDDMKVELHRLIHLLTYNPERTQ